MNWQEACMLRTHGIAIRQDSRGTYVKFSDGSCDLVLFNRGGTTNNVPFEKHEGFDDWEPE